MKSKLHKGLVVKSELKPTVGVLHPEFKYQRESNLREKFQLIRERQAAEAAAEVHTVIQLKRGRK